jgi:hypothetical protein
MISLAFTTLAVYLIIIVIIYKVQKSWSETFYTTGQRVYFTLTFLAVMFLLMEGVKPNLWYIFGAFFLGLVGVAANFKTEYWMAEKVHFYSVYLSIGCFLTGFFIESLFAGSLALNLMLISYYELEKVKNATWWQETAVAVIIYVFLMLLI